MKIEQIETNKIQIILSKEDLDKHQLTLHSIMANSNSAQNLFLAVLDLAEKEIGFETNNCDVTIETLALNNSDLIFTVTKIDKKPCKKFERLHVSREKFNFESTYKFNDFDDFYEFYKIIKFSPDFVKSLFYFNNCFYYVYNNDIKNNNFKCILAEFAIKTKMPSSLIKNFGKVIY
jgi:negative regulator of genetic competence, sporulation and motility